MNSLPYQLAALVLVGGVVAGIKLMNSPRTAVKGNLLGSVCMLGAIILTLVSYRIVNLRLVGLSMAVGAFLGCFLALKVAMIQMPQLVALFNGLGGAASAIVAFVAIVWDDGRGHSEVVSSLTGGFALVVGAVTFSGSGVAAGKLDGRIEQRPIILKSHTILSIANLSLAGLCLSIIPLAVGHATAWIALITLLVALSLGVLFTIRIGGADMPIAISVLNSLSGVAASLAGFAIGNPILVIVGIVVGAAGLVLTQIMCRAMNRTLAQVLTGRTTVEGLQPLTSTVAERETEGERDARRSAARADPSNQSAIASILRQAKEVIIVPGYGMAVAQAQFQVSALMTQMETHGKNVRFAIHPVAGRMPGHMNVLLAEAGVPYEKLYEMDDINPEFRTADLVIVVGANDVVNPAAMTAQGTPIYGMPILMVGEAKHVIVCNLDTQPGYAGVDNPLYDSENTILFLGDAVQTVGELVKKLDETPAP